MIEMQTESYNSNIAKQMAIMLCNEEPNRKTIPDIK